MEETIKYFRSIGVALLWPILCSLISQGCGKDENPENPAIDMTLVGIWEVSEMSSEFQGVTITYTESQLDSLDLVWNFNIKNNGTIEQTTNISGPLVTFQGTWETAADQLTMTLTGPDGEPGTLVYEYIIDGNLLFLKWMLLNETKFYAGFSRQE